MQRIVSTLRGALLPQTLAGAAGASGRFERAVNAIHIGACRSRGGSLGDFTDVGQAAANSGGGIDAPCDEAQQKQSKPEAPQRTDRD